VSIPASVGSSAGAAPAGATIEPRNFGADTVKSTDEAAAEPSAAVKARAQLNTAIVQASLTVSIGAQNEPLTLLLKSAITGINEALKGQYGDDAIQNAVAQDNTPQGTADRIVSLSTGFFEAYKQQHPDQDEAAALDKFMSTIRGGMEKGFQEGRDILQGLKVLNGDVAGNIDQTYELVQKGYAAFEAAHRPTDQGADQAAGDAA
jgi:hypothetical protein